MKKFEMQNLFANDGAFPFTEETPPKWLISHEYKWWWDKHVLTLDVGKYIESDFNRITRVE